jgi:hypothetical protein
VGSTKSPLSILTVGIAIIGVVAYDYLHGDQKPTLPDKGKWVRKYFSKLLNLSIGAFFLAYGFFERSGAPITIGVFGLILLLRPANRKLFPIVLLLFALFVVCFVFARGFDDTRLFLNGATPARFEFSGGNVRNLILVRSGEHALLLFDRDLQQFTFVKFDELKSIVWQRLPLRKIKITQ